MVDGFGHGIGLSQWGNFFLTNQGVTYDRILSHYYQNASLTEMSPLKSLAKETMGSIATKSQHLVGFLSDQQNWIKPGKIPIFSRNLSILTPKS
jgi:hypothetical protein